MLLRRCLSLRARGLGGGGGGDIRSRPHLYLKKIPLAREMDAACQVVNIVNSSFIFFDPLQGYEFKI